MDYKEKIRLAKEALDSDSYDKETIEYIFPELKESESEDERIRKALLNTVKYYHPNESPYMLGISQEQIIAWLEKQGEQKHLSYPIKDNQGSCPCWNNAHDIRPKHLQRCICYDKYMGGVYCYALYAETWQVQNL